MKFASLSVLLVCCLFGSILSFADPQPKFESSAQGFITYRRFQTFENLATTDPYWKKQADLNVLELLGEYEISERSAFEFEIEFEHGGTGSALELDAFEEFGEFESEIERGGEVVLSEFYYKRSFDGNVWLKVGRIPVRISLANMQDRYLMYPAVFSSSAEVNMLPQDWRELGVEGHKAIGDFNFRLSVVNGLNSEFFRTYNWIGGGYQKKFEGVNAADLAINTSIQYGDITKGNGVGVAAYYGDTTGNRYKNGKLAVDGHVLLYSLLGVWDFDRFGIRGQHIQGTLENSDEISTANTALGTHLNPGSFAPLGHEAELSMLELSYDWLNSEEQTLSTFISYQIVNTMKAVEGSVFKNDRYKKLITSIGLMWRFEKVMFLKAEGSQYSTAMTGLPDTKEYQLAFGFDLAKF